MSSETGRVKTAMTEKVSSKAVLDIMEERLRQIEQEGFTHNHDDKAVHGQLATAAACYAAPDQDVIWPWDPIWDKRDKHDRRRQLVIAGALIIAELERIDRLRCPFILNPGLYRLYWKDGGSSLASVGQSKDGSWWYAPINWIEVPSFDWSIVQSVVVL